MTREETRATEIESLHKRLCSERPELASSPITMAFVAAHVDGVRAFGDALSALAKDASDANIGAVAHAAIRYICMRDVMKEIGAGVSEGLLASTDMVRPN